jgi:hypothetical protein
MISYNFYWHIFIPFLCNIITFSYLDWTQDHLTMISVLRGFHCQSVVTLGWKPLAYAFQHSETS